MPAMMMVSAGVKPASTSCRIGAVLLRVGTVGEEGRHLDDIGEPHAAGAKLRLDVAPDQPALIGERRRHRAVHIHRNLPGDEQQFPRALDPHRLRIAAGGGGSVGGVH